MILLNPGPANTTATVKEAMTKPDICPRETEFGDLMGKVAEQVAKVVYPGDDGKYISVLFGGSGTAAVEAALASVVPAGWSALGDRQRRLRCTDDADRRGLRHASRRRGLWRGRLSGPRSHRRQARGRAIYAFGCRASRDDHRHAQSGERDRRALQKTRRRDDRRCDVELRGLAHRHRSDGRELSGVELQQMHPGHGRGWAS